MLSSGLSKHDLGKFNLEEQVHLFLISSYADDQGQVGVKVKSRSTIKPRFVTRNGRYGVLLTISKFYSDNKRCRSAPPPFFGSWRKTPALDITFSSPVSSPERPSSPLLNPPGSPADSSAHPLPCHSRIQHVHYPRVCTAAAHATSSCYSTHRVGGCACMRAPRRFAQEGGCCDLPGLGMGWRCSDEPAGPAQAGQPPRRLWCSGHPQARAGPACWRGPGRGSVGSGQRFRILSHVA